MFRTLTLVAISLLPVAGFSHTHYCEHTHHPDGRVTYYCDRSRTVASETCTGADSNRRPVKGLLFQEFEGPSPTGSWEWQIQGEDESWELHVWSPGKGAYIDQPMALATYYPPQYKGRYSHTGDAEYRGEKSGQNVRLRGTVTPNLSDRPIPRSFDFSMECRSAR